MRKRKKFLFQKTAALILASTVSLTGVVKNEPLLTQAASNSFTLTSKVTLGDGETYQLSTKGNTKGISFQSSNKKIVMVSKSGKIKGQKSGKATVIAKVNKTRKKCIVTVKKAPKAIKIKNGNLEMYTKNMEQLSVRFTNGYSKKVTFQSANKAVATVSSKGLVTAVGEGKTTITATTFNGKKAKISCVVKEVPQETATSTPANTEVPFTTTTASTNTPIVTPTETVTSTPVPTFDTPATSTPVPTFDTPATSTPVPTQQATAIPDNTPTATHVIDSTISPTATVAVPGLVTASAIVSKIENGVVYIDKDHTELQLSEKNSFYKNNYKITKEEIFVGDRITITYYGLASDPLPSVLQDCKIEVTNSRSRLLSPKTISYIDEAHLGLYGHISPFTYEASKTKVFKNGKEIPFSDLKEGDTVRVNYTYHGSDDGKVGFYETLDTVVVLDEDITNTRKASGVITKISTGESVGGDYFYVTFQDGYYCAMLEDTTIVKMKEDGKEFAVDKTRLGVGQTIEVFFEDQSYDLVPTWLSGCKKIVIDTTVPIVTPTMGPSNSPVPTDTPPVTASAIVSKIENGVVYIEKDHTEQQLSEKNSFYKNNYKITKEEIFVGDRITITNYGAASDPLPSVLQDCKIEVTNSRSRLLSPKTISYIDEAHLGLYGHVSPFTYEASKTKVFKNGKEIPFSDLKEGDTVRVNYTYHGSDDGMAGFYETLDTVVVLEDENVYKATKETGVITNIEFGSDDANYYVEFVNGASGIVFVAACTNDTIIKKKDEKTEYVTEKSYLQIGQTISVSYVGQSYDMLPVWLNRCKIVIDTTVPIATPTVKPPVTSSPVPTVTPTDGPLTYSTVVSKIEDGTIYVDDNTREIELTNCTRFYKDYRMITKNEIFAGDTITIKFDGYSGYSPNSFVITNCKEIEVTQSHHRMVYQGTIREIIGGYIYLYYQNIEKVGPLLYDPLQTKIYKDGEEISFEELKEGDTLRVNHTHCCSNGKDDTDGFYEILDSIVVLDEDISHAKKIKGVIESISSVSYMGETYSCVWFGNDGYCAIIEDSTIIKMREDGQEFAVEERILCVGETIEVFFENQSNDSVFELLSGCKKIVIDTSVPISRLPDPLE